MKSRVEIKEQAKALYRKYPIIFVCAGVLTLVTSSVFAVIRNVDNDYVSFLMMLVSLGSALLVFAWEVITGLGFAKFYLTAVDGQEPQFADIFSYASRFLDALRLYALIFIKTFGWTLLFIIPGIVAAYNYSQAPFIFMNNPDMKANDAVNESIRIMDGRKWDLFVLQLSFIGWGILTVFTFGLLNIYVGPYQSLATAGFYRAIRDEEAVQAVAAQYTTPAPVAPAPVAAPETEKDL